MKRGFTLLEVLVAGGVLFIVASAVVGLSNTIIQGTVTNSDRTVMNRWSTEGLELVQKIRDESVMNQSASSLWLQQAENKDKYGWYELVYDSNNKKWNLVKKDGLGTRESMQTFYDAASVHLLADQSTATRFICFESVGAKQYPDNPTDETVYCNSNDNNGSPVNEVRDITKCEDVYCQFSRFTDTRYIPAGNAIKVRSIVVWADKNHYKASDMATILTNWQGYGL